jgi:2,4-dienoyl-CoA reductase-like NADH-dependent reductase (Old Yellow Enzyme family)
MSKHRRFSIDLTQEFKTVETYFKNRVVMAPMTREPLYHNPDLVERFKKGAQLAEADRATFYQGGENGYTTYPALA